MLKISLTQNALILLLPIVVLLFLILLVKSPVFQLYPDQLSPAITFDLVATIPILYLILIWKKKVPKITVVPVFIIGVVIAGAILPGDQQQVLSMVKQWLLPLVELVVLSVIFVRVRKIIKVFRSQKPTADFYTAIKLSTKEVLPSKISPIFAMEIAVIYYGLFAWKRRTLSTNEFTCHKNTGTLMLLWVFTFLVLIEAAVVHIFLLQWSETAAWILTALSLYTALQLIAIIKSISRRPIAVSDNILHLKYGIIAETEIPLKLIKNVERSSKTVEFSNTVRSLSPFKESEGHNIVISLKEQIELTGFYGLKKSANTIVLHVDDPEHFEKSLKREMKLT